MDNFVNNIDNFSDNTFEQTAEHHIHFAATRARLQLVTQLAPCPHGMPHRAPAVSVSLVNETL